MSRPEDALADLDRLLALRPDDTDALSRRGFVLGAVKRYDAALADFERALTLAPSSTNVRVLRVAALMGLDRHDEALESLDKILVDDPDNGAAINLRGKVFVHLERYEAALADFDRALVLMPDRPYIHANRGAVLMALGRNEEALESLDKTLAAEPDNVLALNGRGGALIRLKRYDEARECYDKALALAPDNAEALTHRGLTLAKLNHFDEALADYAHALRLAPDSLHAHVNRGNALLAMKRPDEALASFTDAIAVAPDNPEVNFNAAITRLCLGDFHDGWKQYEYRWRMKEFGGVRWQDMPRPQWRGEKDVQGKTIFLPAEQGMGDAIQFVRYAPMVAALGAKVVVGIHRPLSALIATVDGVSQVIPAGSAMPDFDMYCPLLSLPLAFNTELATIPAKVPYIRPYGERITKWGERLPQNGRLRVGIVWAGSNAHANNARRSMSLERFATVLSVPGVDLISLQKEVSEIDAAILRDHGVLQLGQDFEDFADTAAVVWMLDLVIAVDTSVAHLAGAMAKAVAVLVPYSPDFRWMLDRTDTPWYPTMRLFRQAAVDDWEGPLERVRRELTDLAGRMAVSR